jgi:hypothetical protein
LPGAVVSIEDAADQEVSQQVSDDQGHFRAGDLPPARYHVHAFLEGFQALDLTVVVAPGGTDEVALDMTIAMMTESVTVTASPVVSTSGTLASADTVPAKEAELLAPGEGMQSTLRLLASVITMARGASIDGGHPDQVGYQINSSSIVDPVTGLTRLSLPADAIESVAVLANPYEAEFGRFSSGVVVVQTRRAPERWKTQVENVEPAFRLKRFTLFDIKGIGSLKPDVVTGGVPEIAAARQLSHLPVPGQKRHLGGVHIHRVLECERALDALQVEATLRFLADRNVGFAVGHLDLPIHGQTPRAPIRGIQYDESQLGGTCLE